VTVWITPGVFSKLQNRETKREAEKNEFCSEMPAMAKAATVLPQLKKQAQTHKIIPLSSCSARWSRFSSFSAD
jgi:hypothetical protein